jgi:D-glycero-D-manno-heptose 1,7-bisphosphate phosphatase
MPARIIFLDRDGTINIDHGYVYRVQEWEFTDRAVEALGMLRACGYGLAVVTNQAGISRGFYQQTDVDALHRHLTSVLRTSGIELDAIALCPHRPDGGCDCRKPLTGMARQIESQLQQPIDYARSWTIGDKISDLEFGAKLGTKTALIRSQYWQEDAIRNRPSLIVDSLYDAAYHISTSDPIGDN